MSWQTAITLQIVVSSFLTILTRRIALTTKHVFYAVGLLSYCAIALSGFIYSLVATRGLPVRPHGQAWFYILLEGICIPAAWLVTYRLIRHIGAGNTVIASTTNSVAAALMGVLLLNDSISWQFLIGAILIFASTLVVLWIRPDVDHPTDLLFSAKIGLVGFGSLLYGLGMYGEKQAITYAGVWNYTTFGWGMQAVGALILCTIFGRRELLQVSRRVMQKGLLLGFVTAMSGGLYVYALSRGDLSRTIVATSGKVAITLVLAAVILRERNALRQRFLAFVLSIAGLLLIVR